MEKTGKIHYVNSCYMAPLLAGGMAGFSVEVALYPLDTLKTRLQSEQGFKKAGGFKGVYRGLMIVATTSMPTSALFFVSYETTKRVASRHVAPQYTPFAYMLAASCAEVLACLIRVPTEIAKQRKQTYMGGVNKSCIKILMEAYKTDGLTRGVYRGFFSTVLRDLPFGFIELPVWETLKMFVKRHNDGQINSFQSALCGSISGAFAAGVTNPLDVAKTRIMLAQDYDHTTTTRLKIRPVLTRIYSEAGVKGLFAGVIPRMMSFMLGGFMFFGAYEKLKNVVEKSLDER